eukprot:jgi/Chlat1/4497/Chrsp29S04418
MAPAAMALTVEYAGLRRCSAASTASSSFLGRRVPSAVSRPAGAGSRSRRQLHVQAKIREIFMPALSSTMTEGKIVSWSKGEGDALKKGETVVVVESDKADMDVETFYNGFLAAIVVGDGQVAPVGTPIGLLAETKEEIEAAKAQAASLGTTAPTPAAPVAEPEPAVAEEEAPPPPAPTAAPSAPAPAPAPVAAAPPAPKPAPAPVAAAPVTRTDGRIIATPYAKKRAKELNVDLATVAGSGPNGRIVAEDVEAAAGVKSAPVTSSYTPAAPAVAKASPAPSALSAPAPAAAAPAAATSGQHVPFSTLQSAVARNMNASLAVPVFRVSTSITTDALDKLYKQIKPKGVTMTALLAKAIAVALKEHPIINASFQNNGIQYNESINVCVAVAMPDGGLITPVLKNTDQTDIYQLSRVWASLVDKARAKQLSPDEYNSGTFTLSNLGMFGVDTFDAILPAGQGSILAVGSAKPTVVATAEGLLGVKKVMQVNITCDHRIIYGADGAKFLQTLKKVIEEPAGLLVL